MHRGDPSQSYSWWWNSHFSPKNSKWLQESLSDMDGKVKKMIKIIEEDADSFARRAEMYYKKRPELMKLVEEFYKSYRALAERYDHASGELRQAQKTMAQAFPDQPQFFMNDDGPPLYSNNDAEPQTPEMAHPNRSMPNTDDTSGTTMHFPIAKRSGASNEENNNGLNKKGLKQLNDLLGPRDAHVKRGLNFSEDEGQLTGGKGHLSTNDNQKHMVEVHEKGTQYDVSDYQDKVQEESEEPKPTLETAIFKLQEKHKAALSEKQQYYEMHQRSLEQITALEKEAIVLKASLSKLQQEKEAALAEKQKHHDVYQSCMQQMAVLKGEASDLKTVLSKLQQEKETVASQYQQYQDMYNSCLQRISGLEAELSHAHEEIKRLTDEVFNGVVKYKTTEERAILLEGENRSLHSQMDTLVQKLVLLQEELRRESSELERIRICLQEEHLQSMAREAAFQALQQLHSQSQDQQRAIVMEMQHGMHILKDMERRNTVLEEEVVNLKENYNNMNAQNVSSSIMIKELQGDICSLRDAKGRLEAEVELRMDQRNALQQEIYCLNKDKYDLDKKYKGLIEKLESVGLDAESLQLSVKDLQDENINLKDSCKKKDEEKAILLQSFKNMENVTEKNNLLEKLLSEKEAELRELGSKSNALEELCSSLKKEISVRAEEKDNLVTKVDNLMQTLLRLETLYDETEKQRLLLEKEIFLLKESCNKKDQEKVILSQSLNNLEEVHERNKLLEKLFSGKDNELRQMVQKTNALEEVCNSLKEEIAGLVDEKIRFIGNVQSLKQTLEKMEVAHATTEEQRLHLHKEKELNLTQIKELQTFLDQEKDGHERTIQSSNTKLVNLEDKIKLLQEESAQTRVALEEAEESILDVQIQISIFVSFLEDSHEANSSLVMELQRYNVLSSNADKRISDLEKRSLEQEMQLGSLQEMTNSFASQNKKLQATILQLLELHDIEHKNGYLDKTGHDEVLLRVQTQITSMDGLLAKAEDDRQQMAIESIVAGVLLEQFGLQLSSLHSEKNALGLESLSRGDELSVFRKENQKLIEMNEVLHQKVISLEKKEKELETEVGISHERLRDAQDLSESLRTDNHRLQEENRTFVKDLINLKGQKLVLEEENYIILSEALSLGNLTLIFERFNSEKAVEIKRLSTVLDHISGINYALIEEARITLDKVKNLEMENSSFKSSAVTVEDYKSCSASLKNEVDTFRNACGKLNHQIEHGMKLLKEKELKLSEADEKLEKMQNEKEELLKESDRVVTCLSEIMGKKEALEKELMKLEDDNTNKSGEVDRLNLENQMLKLELDNLRKQVTEFHVREARLKSELQKNLKGIEVLHSSAESLFSDFQGSVIHVILLEQKVQELITACKHLEEHSHHQAREYSNKDTLKDLEVSQLKKENSVLDEQNKTLKLQSCIYLSLIKSLKESIHELEDHRFAFARTSDVTNTSQGVGVGSLDIDTVIGEDEVSDNYMDNGPGELENLKPNIEEVNRMVKNLRNVKNSYDEIRASKEVLEEQLNSLNEEILLKSKEIRSIYDEKERFEVKVDELLREIDEFQLRETYLNSELKEKASEIGLCQTDLETLYQDLQISVIHETFMEEKMKDLLGACMMLEEKALTEGKKFVADIASRCVQIDELNRKVAALEAEKQVNSAEYSNHKSQLAQLKGSLSSIEDHCQKALGKKMDGPICREIRDIDSIDTSDKDVDALEMQQLQTKLNSVEEMVVKLVQLRRQSCTKDEDIGTSEFTTEQGQPKSIRRSMDSAHHQNDPVTKDIQLDHVSDFPSSYESSAGSFAVNELEITNSEDQMLELWETAEQHSARKLEPLAPKKMKLDSTDDALMPLPSKFKNNAKVPAESQTEREVSIDKIVVPLEMSKKEREAVANEVCRLLDMQNNVQGLKKRFGRLKKNNHSSELDINITKDKLENAEVAIVHLLECNHKILEDGHGERVKASSSEIKELGGYGKSILSMGSMNKVHGDKEEGSENIDHLVLELQKIELLLCKLEERQVRRNQQAIQKRSRVILSDYLYGVNQGRRSKLCSCLMPATKGD